MRRFVVLTATLLVLAGCTARRDRDPAPDPAPSSSASSSSAALSVDGRERTYRLYRPASAPAEAPLVIVLHGAVGTGRQAEEAYGWDAQADAGGFVIAYPDGVNRTWNAGPGCCGVAARDDVDDVAFITALVKAVPGTDPARVYATGISNGAMLAYRLACDTDVFAAIAPVAGTMIADCADPGPLSVLAVHGTADRTIPYGGGPGKRSNDGTGRLPVKLDGPPVPELIETWRGTDDCAAPTTSVRGSVTTSAATCPGGRAVELVTIAGAGHQWPGGRSAPAAERLLGLDPPSQAFDATPAIWSFFEQHPRLHRD
ncbi:extracellular catalytic domain type 1 short-chain-length polyhydroxyalkanoate depolymerase [Actinoplanes sp. RD1]|uniref:extracellular catalytic domain type 1 short-chain-length polyhydroxyalkanoate depolymerase n=1 Tax=Actinoplanes sp. RD1 TaxID=3064538 RepID=UPI0027419CE8|nr:PHB depolymerase family esterase [Actinoplanes sp. RD1]